MSKSTSMGSHPLLNGRCQSLLQSTIMGSNPYNGCQSLLQSTRMGSNRLLMADVNVYYSQREYIATFAESICIYKFNECICLFECSLSIYLYIQLRFQYE